MNKKVTAIFGLLMVLLSAIPSSALVSSDVVNGMLTTQSFNKVELVKKEVINNQVIRVQFKLYDSQPLPITVDVLWNVYKIPTKTIYMLPGSALNTESNFITPKNDNLALFLTNKSYFVIGITPREDNAPLGFDYSLMKNWNLEFHTNDVKKIIGLIQSVAPSDYEVLGHSAGSVVALKYGSDIGSSDSKFKGLRIIDIVGQYPLNSQEFINAQLSKNADEQVISQGMFVDNGFTGFKLLSQLARADPSGDSGVPRSPLSGDFTNEGLVFFSAINTNQLPDVLTPITGLPGNWDFKQGLIAGTYEFDFSNPLLDKYSFTHTDKNTLYSALDSVNSGVFPLAMARDFNAVRSNDYPIKWDNIRVPVYWINTGLGFGDVSYSIGLLKNTKVVYLVVKDYGHGDPVYSNTAKVDFWNKLFP